MKKIIFLIIILLLGAGGWFGYKSFLNAHKEKKVNGRILNTSEQVVVPVTQNGSVIGYIMIRYSFILYNDVKLEDFKAKEHVLRDAYIVKLIGFFDGATVNSIPSYHLIRQLMESIGREAIGNGFIQEVLIQEINVKAER